MQFDQDTSSWGPGFWLAIHVAAHTFEKNRKEFITFMNGVAEHIPCIKCRQHCKEYLKLDPLDKLLRDPSPTACLMWTWRFHDAVNQQIEKKYRPQFKEIATYLETLRNGG